MSISLAQYKGPKVGQIIDFVLVNGANKIIEGIGDKFRIITSDGELQIRSNLSPKSPFTTKQGLVADESNLFDRVEIFNDSGATVTARIFFGFGDFLDGSSNILGSVVVTTSALPAGASTSAKQDTLIAKDFATQTTLAAVLAKIVAAPATEAKQDSLIALVPAALDGGRFKVARNAVGAQANAWNAAAVGIGGLSNSVDTLDCNSVSAFGHVDAATTLTLEVSEDNATFYDTTTTVVLAGVADFHIQAFTGAKYARLKSSAAATITATIAAK